jgi:hypothetical protein
MLFFKGQWNAYLAPDEPLENGNAVLDESPDLESVGPEIGGEQNRPVIPNDELVPSPRSQALPPLPPADLPLVSQLPVLIERARVGDPVASCRLAVGVMRCTTHSLISEFEGRLNGSPSARSVAGATISTPRSQETASKCEGFDPMNVGGLDQLLERNKQHLTVRQKVLLALLMPDGTVMRIPRDIPRGVVGSATTGFIYSQFQADNALAFLQEGLLNHDPLALEGLILIHAPSEIPGFNPGMRMTLPNPKRFIRYSLLLTALFGPDALGPIMGQQYSVVVRSFDPNEVQTWTDEARREAASWRNLAPVDVFDSRTSAETERSPACG